MCMLQIVCGREKTPCKEQYQAWVFHAWLAAHAVGLAWVRRVCTLVSLLSAEQRCPKSMWEIVSHSGNRAGNRAPSFALGVSLPAISWAGAITPEGADRGASEVGLQRPPSSPMAHICFSKNLGGQRLKMQGRMVNSSCLGAQRGGFSFSPWFIALHAAGESACRAGCKGKRCWVQGLGGVQGAGVPVPGGAKCPSGCRAGRKGERRMQSWVQAERMSAGEGASRNWGCKQKLGVQRWVQAESGGASSAGGTCKGAESLRAAQHWVQGVDNLEALGCKEGTIWGCKGAEFGGARGCPQGAAGGDGAGRR